MATTEKEIMLGIELVEGTDTEIIVPEDRRLAAKLYVVLTGCCIKIFGDDFPELVKEEMLKFEDRELHKTSYAEKREENDNGTKN